MSKYKELNVWQKAFDLSIFIYQEMVNFPKDELCGLTLQVRRCSVSIFSNIAEGHGHDSNGRFYSFSEYYSWGL